MPARQRHLGPHLGLGRHLQRQTAPARQHLVIERRGMARDHHLAGQILEQVQERDMVDLLVVEAIAPCRTAGSRADRGDRCRPAPGPETGTRPKRHGHSHAPTRPGSHRQRPRAPAHRGRCRSSARPLACASSAHRPPGGSRCKRCAAASAQSAPGTDRSSPSTRNIPRAAPVTRERNP